MNPSQVSLKGSGIRLVLAITPPGNSQRAALREWCARIAARDGAVVAWMRLRRLDNHPDAFLAHLDQALAPVFALQAGLPEQTGLADGCALSIRTAATLAGEESNDGFGDDPGDSSACERLEDGITECLNRLADFPGELLLVLDGYQAIDSPDIHAAVSRMLEYLPYQVHLVLTTRREPPLPLPRLRARRQLLEVGEPNPRQSDSGG